MFRAFDADNIVHQHVMRILPVHRDKGFPVLKTFNFYRAFLWHNQRRKGARKGAYGGQNMSVKSGECQRSMGRSRIGSCTEGRRANQSVTV